MTTPPTSTKGLLMREIGPRHRRALRGLLAGPLMREELDRVAAVSNGPALVAELRALGLEIPCERVPRIDRDGRQCRPGRYALADADRAIALKLLPSSRKGLE